MTKATETRTTCPYCGVGCGVVLGRDAAVRGDAAHPSNRGRLCSKGAALGATLIDADRLIVPTVDGRPSDWDTALDRVATRFSETIAAHGPDSVAFYLSGQCLTEDYYVANKLMKGFIGSANIDTNSRLCMASSVAGHVRAFGEDVVPGVYEDWDEADLVVLVGSNAAWCHPVLYQRLLAARKARGTRIVVLDPRRTATASQADLHIPLAAGSDVLLFQGLLAHLAGTGRIDGDWTDRHVSGLADAVAAARADAPDIATVADGCDVDAGSLATLYRWFGETGRAMTVYSQGVNQAADGTDKVNAIINCHLATGRIGRPGAGPFSVTGQPNAMGGREVGGLANQLAAHLRFDRPADLDTLRRFWGTQALATRPGLKAIELFDAMLEGRVKAVWIMATNPAASLPRAQHVRDALAACPFVVVSDCWPTDTTAYADVLLPAAGWGEKNGTVTSSERRISRQRAFRRAPGQARPDWWMLAETGRRMGWAGAFTWAGAEAVFREHAALSGFENDGGRVFDISALADLTRAEYDALAPIRWPMPAGCATEAGRLFTEGGFPLPDARARLIPMRYQGRPPVGHTSLLLNTGRTRDQWHTMTRTGLVASLMTHEPEPTLSVHPDDAAAHGLRDADHARVVTAEGVAILRVAVSDAQRRGEIFAPMHWTDAFASTGPIGRLATARRDPMSGQPALKATPARIEAVTVPFEGLLLRVPGGPLPDLCHWTRQTLESGHLYRIAGLRALPEGRERDSLVASLLAAPYRAELIDLADGRRGTLRAAALSGGKLVAWLVLARERAALPAPETMAALLGQAVADDARARLLAGQSPSGGKASSARICACFGVGRDTIIDAIHAMKLSTAAEIGATLRAGTNCGSCVPELEALLRDVRLPAI